MHDPSSALNAAIRAMRGESDMDAVRPALGKRGLVCVIACAPDTHRIVRAAAALRDGLTALLDAPIIADHALHDAVERMIGTPEGRIVLDSWADIVPAGRGRAYAAALIDAVQKKQCASGVAAALIGPCNDSAALLRDTWDIAFAIRRWGQTTHDTPIAWTDALSPEERERLLDTIQRSPSDVARCLPWLPPDRANHMSLDTASLCLALDAFAKASPTVQALYTDLMLHLVAQAQSEHLRSITRLACATQADDVWARVQTLIWEHPEHAERVVYEAPWDDLPKMVRDIAAELNPIISAARGRRDATTLNASAKNASAFFASAARGRRDATTLNASAKNASAFFAVLDPRVWDALDVATQTRWRQSLRRNAHLAVRSLGLRPEFLPHASLSNELIHAARRHTHDSSIVRWTLLPITLRLLPIAEAHDRIAALPTTPPDPSAFFLHCNED